MHGTFLQINHQRKPCNDECLSDLRKVSHVFTFRTVVSSTANSFLELVSLIKSVLKLGTQLHGSYNNWLTPYRSEIGSQNRLKNFIEISTHRKLNLTKRVEAFCNYTSGLKQILKYTIAIG